MATDDARLKWIPVEDYAADMEIEPSELVSMILDGQLPGERQGNRWYVSAPLVQLVHPNAASDTGLLKIAACRLGCYVTAGRGELGIPLRFTDPGRPAALAALNAAMASDTPPDLPVEIHLDGEHLKIDSSLWGDLSAALMEYQTLMDPSVEGLQ
jgi:hypothetical protein